MHEQPSVRFTDAVSVSNTFIIVTMPFVHTVKSYRRGQQLGTPLWAYRVIWCKWLDTAWHDKQLPAFILTNIFSHTSLNWPLFQETHKCINNLHSVNYWYNHNPHQGMCNKVTLLLLLSHWGLLILTSSRKDYSLLSVTDHLHCFFQIQPR